MSKRTQLPLLLAFAGLTPFLQSCSQGAKGPEVAAPAAPPAGVATPREAPPTEATPSSRQEVSAPAVAAVSSSRVMFSLESEFAAACEWVDGQLVSEREPARAEALSALLRELGQARPCFEDPALPVALRRHFQLRLRAGGSQAAALERLAELAGVASALPGNLSQPASPWAEPLVGTQRPDEQWYLEHMGVTRAWDLASGRGVRVAVIDLGFDLQHPDLGANVLAHLARDFANPSEPDEVDDGDRDHGTATTSLLAAPADGQGMAGVAYEAEVIPYQWRTREYTDEVSFETAIANAIVHAASLSPGTRPQIILPVVQIYHRGTIEYYPVMRDAVAFAVDAGVHVVLPAGNTHVHLRRERRYDTGSIVVGASTPQDVLADWSNYGERLDVVAPGQQILVAAPGGGYIHDFWGTSAASPLTAGVVALMLERNPNLSPTELRSCLRVSVRVDTGIPMLDAELAVRLAIAGGRPDDHGESLVDATPLTDELSGELERSGDEDTFRFESSGNDVQVFQLHFPDGDLPETTLEVLDQDGKTVMRPWDRDVATYAEVNFWVDPRPGTYYLRVRSRVSTGRYRVTRDVRTP